MRRVAHKRQVTLVGGGPRAARLPVSCSAFRPHSGYRAGSTLRDVAGESHSDRPAPAPML